MFDTLIIFINMILVAAILVTAGSGVEKHAETMKEELDPSRVRARRSAARFEFFSDLLYGVGLIAFVNAVLLLVRAIFS